MEPVAIIDALIYGCYAFNREKMSAERLARIFPERGAEYEARYQAELAIKRARA
jgi:hypothetical protein